MATLTSQLKVGCRCLAGQHRVLVRVPPELPEGGLVRAVAAGRGGGRRGCGASLAGSLAGQVRSVARPGESGHRVLGGRSHASRLPTILESGRRAVILR